MKKFKLIVVAYSHVEREFFPTKASYDAEIEVEDRAVEVVEEIEKLGIEVKGIPGNQYSLYRGSNGGNGHWQQPESYQEASYLPAMNYMMMKMPMTSSPL